MARFVGMLGGGSAALALVLGSTAHAGPTGSSDGGSGSGSSDGGTTTDSGSTSGSETSSGGGSEGSWTTGSEGGSEGSGGQTGSTGGTTAGTTAVDETAGCGRCEEGPGTITITSPADGATVDAPFTVEVVVTPTCSCDGCRCGETPAEYVQVFLDTVAWGAPCYEAECSWEVAADLGAHTIYAAATFGPDDVVATTIEVHVQSVAPGTETGIGSGEEGPPPPGSESSTGPAASGEDAPKGCGCGAPIERSAAWLLVLAALGRRRPHRARR